MLKPAEPLMPKPGRRQVVNLVVMLKQSVQIVKGAYRRFGKGTR